MAEIGFYTILHSSIDAKLLCLQRFTRMFAYGLTYPIFVQFLSRIGISQDRTGLFMMLTLLGDTAISLGLTAFTDGVGRRYILAAGALLMSLSGFAYIVSSNYWVLLVASIIGVISPNGNEIGPFKAIEESILAQLTAEEDRSDIFAWYMLLGSAGAALGTISSGWLVQGLESRQFSLTTAYRSVFVLYAVCGLAKLVLVTNLTQNVEAEKEDVFYHELEDSPEGNSGEAEHEPNGNNDMERMEPQKPSLTSKIFALFTRISPSSRSILIRLITFFTLDSFASGMASPSWISYFFTTVHSLEPRKLGSLFFVTNILATISNLLALPLAHRLGPLKTMVFTHLPSALFLSLIPIPSASASGRWFAMAFLALRSCTSSMDQAPRQAFLSAAVKPQERTAVLSVVNITKTLAQAGGLGTAGVLANGVHWIVLLSGAGAIKAGYDLLMLWMFLGVSRPRDSFPVPCVSFRGDN